MSLFDKAIAVLRDPEASSDAKDLAEQIVREWKDRAHVYTPVVTSQNELPRDLSEWICREQA